MSSLSTMFVLGFGTVPSAWYFLFFILLPYILYVFMKEEFEDTKGVVRIRISKKNIHNNDQKKKYKRTNNDLQNIHIKLKIE